MSRRMPTRSRTIWKTPPTATSNEAVEDALESNAAAIREAGEDKEEAIDNADVNAAAVNTQ